MLPASEASAPFGMRIASVGVCSNESGIERSRILIAVQSRSSAVQEFAVPVRCSGSTFPLWSDRKASTEDCERECRFRAEQLLPLTAERAFVRARVERLAAMPAEPGLRCLVSGFQ